MVKLGFANMVPVGTISFEDILTESTSVVFCVGSIRKTYCPRFGYNEYMDPLAKSLGHADKSWTFLDGSKRAAVALESVAIGRGEYLPGWRWSLHAGSQTGKDSAAHIGYVLSGEVAICSADGKEITIRSGDAFEIGPGHDARVVVLFKSQTGSL